MSVAAPPPGGAITKSNLLRKLCFVRFGGPLEQNSDEFRSELYGFLRNKSTKSISRQTIQYWLDEKSTPSRVPALLFIGSYVEELIQYSNLTDEQKKVYDQIVRYIKHQCNRQGVDGASAKIYNNNNNRIIIDASANSVELASLSDAIKGVYFTYRAALLNGKTSILQEMMRIYGKGREVRFEHWYMSEDGDATAKFDGSVFIYGNMLWFAGASTKGFDRLRIIAFKHIKLNTRKFRDVMWGLMLTDIPVPSSLDPAACRFLIIRCHDKISDIDSFAKENIKYIEKPDTTSARNSAIARLVSNNITALSMPSSKDIATDMAGQQLIDRVLRVSHDTIEKIVDDLL